MVYIMDIYSTNHFKGTFIRSEMHKYIFMIFRENTIMLCLGYIY